MSLVEQASASLDEAVETVGGALEGLLGDAPPAPPLSEPDAVADRVVAYVSQGDRFSFPRSERPQRPEQGGGGDPGAE